MNVDGVFSGHHLVDGRTALLLLATLLRRSHSARPKLERKGARDCGEFFSKGLIQVARVKPEQGMSSKELGYSIMKFFVINSELQPVRGRIVMVVVVGEVSDGVCI